MSENEIKRVLLVEDDDFLREILHEKLKHAEYEVTSLEDGLKVLDTVVTIKPHIVLLDIMMPNKSGYEVIDELKADDRTKDVPIVVLSNLGQEKDVSKAKEAGAHDFLTKANFMPEEIIEKINVILAVEDES